MATTDTPQRFPGILPSVLHNDLTSAAVFVTAPGGVVFVVGPEYAALCAERLARLIPGWACAYVADGGYWVVTARYAGMARAVLIITCGSLLRLWAPSYPAALERLPRGGQAAVAERQSGRAA